MKEELATDTITLRKRIVKGGTKMRRRHHITLSLEIQRGGSWRSATSEIVRSVYLNVSKRKQKRSEQGGVAKGCSDVAVDPTTGIYGYFQEMLLTIVS